MGKPVMEYLKLHIFCNYDWVNPEGITQQNPIEITKGFPIEIAVEILKKKHIKNFPKLLPKDVLQQSNK